MESIQVKSLWEANSNIVKWNRKRTGGGGRMNQEKKTNTKENEGTEATSTNEAEKVSAGVFKMGYTTVLNKKD